MATAAPTPFLATPRSWNTTTLIELTLREEDALIAWLMAKGLLASSADCPKCDSSCRMAKHKGSPIWRCPRKGCQTRVSIKAGSFFSQTKLSFATALKLMFQWTRQQRVTETAKDVGVTPKIAIDWYNFCRDICEEHFLANPITIGGPGKTVEIDESKFGKYTYIFMTDLYTVLVFVYLRRTSKLQWYLRINSTNQMVVA